MEKGVTNSNILHYIGFIQSSLEYKMCSQTPPSQNYQLNMAVFMVLWRYISVASCFKRVN